MNNSATGGKQCLHSERTYSNPHRDVSLQRPFGRIAIALAVGLGAIFLLSQCKELSLVSTIRTRVTGYASPGAWSGSELVCSASSPSFPHVGLNNDGLPIVAWLEDWSQGTEIMWAREENNTWQQPRVIAQGSDLNSFDFDFEGTTGAAVWLDASKSVCFSLYNDNTHSWTTGKSLGTDYPGKDPSVAVVYGNAARITWEGSTDGVVYAAEISSTGEVTEIATIGTGHRPGIMANVPEGQAVIIYQRDDHTLCATRAEGSTWSTPVFLDTASTIASYDLDFGNFSGGNADAVWLEQAYDFAKVEWDGGINFGSATKSNAIALSGDHAIVASGSAGIQVVDVSDSKNPQVVKSVATTDAQDLAVQGSSVYVADGAGGLKVVDVGEPATSHVIGSHDTDGTAYGVAASGDYAYVVDGTALRVFDVSDPSAPTPKGSVTGLTNARGVAVSGNFAYVADNGAGLRVYDVSDPDNISETGHLLNSTMTQATDVVVSGNYAYVADGITLAGSTSGGLRIIDVSDPSTPTEVGYLTGGVINGVCTYGTHAFSAYSDEAAIIDISNPTTPSLVADEREGNYAGVATNGNKIYLAKSDGGMSIDSIGVTDTLSVVGKRLWVKGDTWSDPIVYGSAKTTSSADPHVAGKANGDVMVLWKTEGELDANLHQAGSLRGPYPDIGNGSEINALVDGQNGGFYYVSMIGDGRVNANVFRNDSWAKEVEIATNGRPFSSKDSFALSLKPSIAVDSQGHAITVWAGQDGIYASRYTPPE